MSAVITIGIDPPRAWSVWRDDILAAAGQVEGDSLAAALTCATAALAAAGPRTTDDAVVAVIEVPWGVSEESTIPDMLVEAEAAGLIRGILTAHGVHCRRTTVAEWRRNHRFPKLSRQDAKALAMKIAASCASDHRVPYRGKNIVLTGPRGGLRYDAAEAVCIGAPVRKQS